MADEKKRPSVAEILAAARKADTGKGGESAPSTAQQPSPGVAAVDASEPAVEEVRAEAPPVPAKPAAKPPAAKPPASKPTVVAAGGSRMSVADMMAAARAQKADGVAPAPKPAPAKTSPAKPPAEKPAKPAAAKPAAAKTAAAAVAVATAPKATASILAAARTGEKPGPMTKAEAATKPQPPREPVAAAKAKLTVPPMPPKPAYAVPKPAKAEKPVEDRRGFMSLLFGSFLGLGFTTFSVSMGLWTLGTARFMFPNILTEPPSRFKVGFKDSLSPGQVETKYVAQYGVWVCNYEYKGQKQIYALKTVCTHLGCTPNWLEGEQKFKCPCHGSGFYKDGINFEGPAPRPLERYSIRVGDDGQLEVDKSKTFHEELGQWADPTSFVVV
jgi:cytochrome b6-f complex iron-sulfur subunit